jgi:hypothetical protein
MKIRISLLVGAVLLCGVVTGCATAKLTAGGAEVAPTPDAVPPECKNLGLVTGKGGGTFGGGMVSNEDLIEYAMNDLRNKTAELGGTHVRHDPPQMGQGDGTTTTVTMTGTAYNCPESIPRSQ